LDNFFAPPLPAKQRKKRKSRDIYILYIKTRVFGVEKRERERNENKRKR